MDPQQIALVKSTFAVAAADGDALARAFYDRLFTAAPGLEDLFASDSREQERKLMRELEAIVGLLDHVGELVERTRVLGIRHGGFGARADHYELVGVALVDALGEVLGPRMTPAAEQAWRCAYNLVSEAMQQGAARVACQDAIHERGRRSVADRGPAGAGRALR